MKTKNLILSMFLALIAFSCSDNDDKPQETITSEEMSINTKIDIANDDVIDVVAEEELDTYADNTNGRIENNQNSLATCVAVSRVPDFGTPIAVGTTVTKTIDFGTGCTLPNGNVLKGKIIISFVYEPSATSHTITYTFDNFYHNNIKFGGTKTFIRTMTVATAASPSHPIVTMNMDITVTLPDGRVFTRTGQRIREIIEGYDTVSWTDNVYKVTGSWTTTFPSATIQTANITSPLIVKMSCIAVNKPLIVQGVITYSRGSQTATLDFGDGTCDNIAIFTHNGISVTIIIGN